MYSLVLMICTAVNCQSATPEMIFVSEKQCEAAAAYAEFTSKQKIETGALPNHRLVTHCHNWGLPS